MTPNQWLDKHLEEWVRPKVGFIPAIIPDAWYLQSWKRVHTLALQGVWKEGKKLAKDRTILLAGRDVWCLEILARIEEFPTIFRPDISSTTCHHVKEDYSKCYLLDTGFSGSVPKAMKIPNFGLVKYNPKEYYGWYSLTDHQIFPRAKRADPIVGPVKQEMANMMKNGLIPANGPLGLRGFNGVVLELASLMESCPKYWVQGYSSCGRIIQTLESREQMIEAARFTMYVIKTMKKDI